MSMTALRSIKIKKCSLICMPNYKIPICFFPFSMTTLLQLGVHLSRSVTKTMCIPKIP